MSSLGPDDWVDEGVRVVARAGVGGVRIASLAQELGVTKGSFYWHFTDRDELLRAILSRWEDRATDAIIRHVEATSPDPAERLASLVAATIHADAPSAALEGAIRAWGQSDASVASVLQRVDQRRLDYTAGLLEEHGLPSHTAQARAALLYRVLVGEFTFLSVDATPLSDDAVRECLTLVTSLP